MNKLGKYYKLTRKGEIAAELLTLIEKGVKTDKERLKLASLLWRLSGK